MSRRVTSAFFAGTLAFAVLGSISPLRANELTVDRKSIRLNDLLTISVTVEGPFASVESLSVPLANLKVVGDASTSSEFSWTNGEVKRRKTFRYRARPEVAGVARVGPLVLHGSDGQKETLAAIEIAVSVDPVSGSNDPAVVLRELLASGREPLFVVAEVIRSEVFVGESFELTWWLYNAASVQQWQVAGIPKLEDFWTEERPRDDTPERVYVGDVLLQRLPIRRAVLFPLRSGAHRIAGLTVEAAVMRRNRTGPFGMFEGELVETSFTSAPVEIRAKALPPGPPVNAVGQLTMSCAPPLQENGGPVVVNVMLQGRGNVRAAQPPQFAGAIRGSLQIEGGEVTVAAAGSEFAMRRQWRHLVFPSRSGPMTIPPLTMLVFDPAAGTRVELRCKGTFFDADVTAAPVAAAPPIAAARKTRSLVPWIAAGLGIVLVTLLLVVPPLRRELALRQEVRDVLRDAQPAEILVRIHERGFIDDREASDRGDAWRALRSLLAAAERDRDIAVDSSQEIARRVKDVLRPGRDKG